MAQQVSISLEKDHIRAVERYGKKIGVGKFSVVLQAIITQFDQQQKAADFDTQKHAWVNKFVQDKSSDNSNPDDTTAQAA